MELYEVLEAKRDERGISFAELSRRTGVNYDVLIRAFKGTSMLKGDQLIRVCRELHLEMSDFDECPLEFN